MLIKTLKVLRNNWKKSVFLSCVAVWGTNYAKNKVIEYNIMRRYCEEALRYGNLPQSATQQTRHITVILNPIANNKKGRNLYDKYAAPLFHLAGVRVSLVLTESEGQASQLMEIMDNTDAVVIAGGNGTLHEAITGLLRREDWDIAAQRIPIGIIPVGKRNTISYALNEFNRNKLTNAEVLAESAMSVIRELIKHVDVLKISGSRGKPVYALDGLNFGAFRDVLINVDKYWYFGGKIKPYLAFFVNSFKSIPSLEPFELSYTEPCNGCSKCYKRFEVRRALSDNSMAGTRWWHIFLSRKGSINKDNGGESQPKIDLRTVINERCGQWSHLNLSDAINLYVRNTNESKLQIAVHSSPLTQNQFISDGVKLVNCELPLPESTTDTTKTGTIKIIEANDINLKLANQASDDNDTTDSISQSDTQTTTTTTTTTAGWFSIDTESYEQQSVSITLMPKIVKIYAK